MRLYGWDIDQQNLSRAFVIYFIATVILLQKNNQNGR